MNTLEILTWPKLGGKTMLNCKGIRAYLEAKQRHGLLLSKLPPNSKFSQDMSLSQFWQPRAMLQLLMGVQKKKMDEVFIEEGHHQLSEKAADIHQPQRMFDGFCLVVQRVSHTIRY